MEKLCDPCFQNIQTKTYLYKLEWYPIAHLGNAQSVKLPDRWVV